VETRGGSGENSSYTPVALEHRFAVRGRLLWSTQPVEAEGRSLQSAHSPTSSTRVESVGQKKRGRTRLVRRMIFQSGSCVGRL